MHNQHTDFTSRTTSTGFTRLEAYNITDTVLYVYGDAINLLAA